MRTFVVLPDDTVEPLENCVFVSVREDRADKFKNLTRDGYADEALDLCESVIDEDITDYLPWDEF